MIELATLPTRELIALVIMCGGLLIEIGIGIAAVVALLTEKDESDG